MTRVIGLFFTLAGGFICSVIAVTGYTIWKLDKKRVSDPNYQANLREKRKLDRANKMNRIKSRLSMIPEPLDMERKRQFVICKFLKAIKCLKKNEEELATEHISDALYVFSCKGANRFLAHTNTLSPRMYHLVHTKYRELKNTHRELKNNGGESLSLA